MVESRLYLPSHVGWKFPPSPSSIHPQPSNQQKMPTTSLFRFSTSIINIFFASKRTARRTSPPAMADENVEPRSVPGIPLLSHQRAWWERHHLATLFRFIIPVHPVLILRTPSYLESDSNRALAGIRHENHGFPPCVMLGPGSLNNNAT